MEHYHTISEKLETAVSKVGKRLRDTKITVGERLLSYEIDPQNRSYTVYIDVIKKHVMHRPTIHRTLIYYANGKLKKIKELKKELPFSCKKEYIAVTQEPLEDLARAFEV